MNDDDNSEETYNHNEKTLKILKWGERRLRLFIVGSEEDLNMVIAILQQKSWYKSSIIDGQISQVNFSRPVRGSTIYNLLPGNVFNHKNEHSNSSSSKQTQSSKLRILTSNNQSQNITNMRLPAKFRYFDSLQLQERQKNTNQPQSSVFSSPKQKHQVQKLNDDNIICENILLNNSPTLLPVEFNQCDTNNSCSHNVQSEELTKLIGTFKDQISDFKDYCDDQYKPPSKINENMKNVQCNITTVRSNQNKDYHFSLEKRKPEQEFFGNSSVQHNKIELIELEEGFIEKPVEEDLIILDSNDTSFQNFPKTQKQRQKKEQLFTWQKQQREEHLNMGIIYQNNMTNSEFKIASIFKRINEMIANENIFDYVKLRKQLQEEGYLDSDILATFGNKRPQIDNLREIFQSIIDSQSLVSSYSNFQTQNYQPLSQPSYVECTNNPFVPMVKEQELRSREFEGINELLTKPSDINLQQQLQPLQQQDHDLISCSLELQSPIFQPEESAMPNNKIANYKFIDIKKDESITSSKIEVQYSNPFVSQKPPSNLKSSKTLQKQPQKQSSSSQLEL